MSEQFTKNDLRDFVNKLEGEPLQLKMNEKVECYNVANEEVVLWRAVVVRECGAGAVNVMREDGQIRRIAPRGQVWGKQGPMSAVRVRRCAS